MRFVAPRNPIEQDIVAIWETLLGVHGVGINDDFFAIGGDSLLASRLLLELYQHYGLALTADEFLTSVSTVEKLSQIISKHILETNKDKDKEHSVDFVTFGLNLPVENKDDLYVTESTLGLRRLRPSTRYQAITVNSLGFRSPEIEPDKPKNLLRIAFLGSSETFDPYAKDNKLTWPHQAIELVQKNYRRQAIDYINGAVSGYNLQHIRAAYTHYIKDLAPDIILISAFDLNRDTAYLARNQKLYSGVHHQPSAFAQTHPALATVEKNILAFWRSFGWHSGKKLLEIDPQTLTQRFQKRLRSLVRLCQENGAETILITGIGRLRSQQSRIFQRWYARSSLYFMPYLSVAKLLQAQALYNEAIYRVADQTGARTLDVSKAVPPDSKHYTDAVHFTAVGSTAMAQSTSALLLSAIDKRSTSG